jgi:hypothetical protein
MLVAEVLVLQLVVVHHLLAVKVAVVVDKDTMELLVKQVLQILVVVVVQVHLVLAI